MNNRFRTRVSGICPALPLSAASLSGQPALPQTLVIQGGTLIDGNGGAPVEDAAVVIDGNRIESVAGGNAAAIAGGATVIGAEGKFILPGLWDSQVSYSWYFGEIMLNYGITSTIDVGNSREVAIAHRDAVHAGPPASAAPATTAASSTACTWCRWTPGGISTPAKSSRANASSASA